MTTDRKKICKVLSFFLVAVLAFSLFFAYLFYLDLKKTFTARLSGKASSLVGQQIHIGDISFSLSSGINMYDIQIQNPQGFPPGQLLKIKKIALNMHYRELFGGKLHFRNIVLSSPVLTVMKNPEGRLNISDEFRRFLSKKGTLTYEVDEFRLLSGMTDFNSDIRFRGDRIHLILRNLSSNPGTKTLIAGDALLSGENRVKIDGWANLKDEPKKFRISASAEDFRLSPFREMLAGYHIDSEKTRMRMRLDAEGDTGKGVKLTSGIQIKSPGHDFYKNGLLDINLDAELFYDISAGSATIRTLSVKAGDASALRLKGRIKDLAENPAYDLEMKIESLDLSAFNIMRGFRTSGILVSDSIRMKGRFDHPMPELDGSIQMEGVSVISDAVAVKNMNGRMIFSSADDITARAEVTADVLHAGGYALSRPAAVRLSLKVKGRQRNVALSAVMNASPIEMKSSKEKELSLRDLHISMDGRLKGNIFSGNSTAHAEGIRYNDYSFKKLKCVLAFHYGQGSIAIKNPRVETEDFSSSAELVKIEMTGRKGGLSIEAKNMNAAYPLKKAALQGLDFAATLDTIGNNISGDINFSAAGVMFREIKSGKITGSGNFHEREFFVNIPLAEFAGGRIMVIAEGNTFQKPLPVKVEMTAEHIDLVAISAAAEKFSETGFRISGDLKKARFKGIIDSKTSLQGEVAMDLQKFSVVNNKTQRYILKDTFIQSAISLQGSDCAFNAAASAGNVAVTVSGTAKEFLGEERSVSIHGHLKETPATEIRNSFWDTFPDSLLYAGMDGSLSSDFNADYRKDGVTFNGELRLKDFLLEGENGEYSVGPVNGVVPFAYGKFDDGKKPIALPSFERSEFSGINRYYAEAYPGVDYNRITIGSVQYGFRLLKDLNIWLKQDGGILNVGRFSANIFGGSLNGSAVIDLTDGFHYRAGMILKGLSLTRLCDDIETLKGYISGKVDGIGLLKGSGADIAGLIGRADLWTYATEDEKTKISREFLQKIGGPSIKSYLGDRHFDKGVMSLYIQKGFLIFKEMEISNRNIFGIQDLSVKVAPLSNRIAIDHLMWTIVQAANRAKKNNE